MTCCCCKRASSNLEWADGSSYGISVHQAFISCNVLLNLWRRSTGWLNWRRVLLLATFTRWTSTFHDNDDRSPQCLALHSFLPASNSSCLLWFGKNVWATLAFRWIKNRDSRFLALASLWSLCKELIHTNSILQSNILTQVSALIRQAEQDKMVQLTLWCIQVTKGRVQKYAAQQVGDTQITKASQSYFTP